LNYLTTVEQFFLSLKDSGLTLSASDYQLIVEWESRNIPVGLVCRAIENSYCYFLEKNNRRNGKTSLVQIQKAIEEEIQQQIYKQ
jgi:hypothetical protein